MEQRKVLMVAAAALAAAIAIPAASVLGKAGTEPPASPVFAAADTPIANTFTYQGRLTDGGAPANGVYDIKFTFYDAETAGTAVGDADTKEQTKEDVLVTNGLFSTTLNANGVFGTGAARWIELAVRPGSSVGTFTVLSPRQAVSPTPYAFYAKAAGSVALPFAASAALTAGAALDVTNASTTTGSAAKLTGPVALELNGALKVSGTKAGFQQVTVLPVVGPPAVAGNTCGTGATGGNATVITNPLTDNDPTAMLQVTQTTPAGGTVTAAVPPSVQVMYSPAGCVAGLGKWVIVSSATLATGDTFNVLVVKQ